MRCKSICVNVLLRVRSSETTTSSSCFAEGFNSQSNLRTSPPFSNKRNSRVSNPVQEMRSVTLSHSRTTSLYSPLRSVTAPYGRDALTTPTFENSTACPSAAVTRPSSVPCAIPRTHGHTSSIINSGISISLFIEKRHKNARMKKKLYLCKIFRTRRPWSQPLGPPPSG